MGIRLLVAAMALLLADTPASASVDDVGASGFAITEFAHVAVSPDLAFAALIVPARWWDSSHTFSQNAANLTLDAKAGGCWCESLPGGGSVLHMTVVYAVPGKALRLRGALGPLQGMGADGAMTFALTPVSGGGTDVTLTYVVGGYTKSGFVDIAAAVDRVLGEQLARFAQSVNSR